MNKHDKSFYINKHRDSNKNISNVIRLNKSVTDAQSNVWKEHCDNSAVASPAGLEPASNS